MRSRGPRHLVISLLVGVLSAAVSATADVRRVPINPPATLLHTESVASLSTFGDALWLGQPGSLREFAPRADGTLAVQSALPVAETARPVDMARFGAIAGYGLRFVLDSANQMVLVYAVGSAKELARLATGTEPVALAIVWLGDASAVVVANAGSDDLSVYRWRSVSSMLPGFGSEVRVPVGDRPRALAYEQDYRGGTLAVAEAGSGTVSLLAPARDFRRVSTIRVGGVPAVLAWANQGTGPLRCYPCPPDLVVGDAAAPRVRVLRGDERSLDGPWLSVPRPASSATRLAVADLNGDEHDDLVVADYRLAVFYGRGLGRFAASQALGSASSFAAVAAGEFAGDVYHADLALIDQGGASLQLRPTRGDAVIAAPVEPTDLSADASLLAWSQRDHDSGYRLALRRGESIAAPRSVVSERPLRPRVGRSAAGRPVVAYVACRRGACSPYVWDVVSQRERRQPISVPAGCRLRTVALWHPWVAYDVFDSPRCRRPDRGIRVRRRGSRGTLRFTGALGDFRAGVLAWTTPWRGFGQQVRVARIGHRARTVDRVPADCECWLEPPTLEGEFIVWGVNKDRVGVQGADLWRLPLDRPRSCAQTFRHQRVFAAVPPLQPPNASPEVDYTASGDHVFYASGWAIFQVDRHRLRWQASCRPAR
jgi:hypothetical protein